MLAGYISGPGGKDAAQFHANLLFLPLFAISGYADGALARCQMKTFQEMKSVPVLASGPTR